MDFADIYYVSDLLYAPKHELINKKPVTLHVITVNPWNSGSSKVTKNPSETTVNRCESTKRCRILPDMSRHVSKCKCTFDKGEQCAVHVSSKVMSQGCECADGERSSVCSETAAEAKDSLFKGAEAILKESVHADTAADDTGTSHNEKYKTSCACSKIMLYASDIDREKNETEVCPSQKSLNNGMMTVATSFDQDAEAYVGLPAKKKRKLRDESISPLSASRSPIQHEKIATCDGLGSSVDNCVSSTVTCKPEEHDSKNMESLLDAISRKLWKVIGAVKAVILDIDLDFFSTTNPFRNMFSAYQYSCIKQLYSFNFTCESDMV